MTSRRNTLLAALALVGLISAPLAAHAEKTVTIGYSGPLSGGAALYGKNVLNGAQMAVDEINEQGLEVAGEPVKLVIKSLDDQYNPSQTAINAQRLVQQDKAPAILVPHSGGIFAVMTRNEQQNLLLLAYSSVPRITEEGNKLTIRVTLSYDAYIQPFVKYGMEKWGNKVAMAETDSDYGKAWGSAFRSAWEEAGGEVVTHNSLSYNKSADFYSGVSKVLAAKPDVIFAGGPSEPTGLVIKQARELGYQGGFLLIDQAKMEEVKEITGGYEALEGTIGIMPLDAMDNPDTLDFLERFAEAYKSKNVTYEQAINYINVHAFARAMQLAGETADARAIRAHMDEAYKALPAEINFLGFKGVDENGGTLLDPLTGVAEGGEVTQREFN